MTALHTVLVGHFAKDILPDGGYMLGGTVFYSGVQSQKLGNRVTIISSKGDDLALDALPADIQVHIQASPKSTTFENIYDAQGHRTQYLHDKATPLSPDFAPMLAQKPDILHLCPIMDEVASDYARAYPDSKVCITPQGWLRQVNERGLVSPKAWDNPEKVLAGAYALVFSEEDMGYDEQKISTYAKQCPFVVCTRGGKPASLFYAGGREEITPFPTSIIDPTGAGDIFATAFFTRLIETGNPREAVIFAHLGASASIQARGVAGILSKEDIIARLKN
jgi:sugar/nucleoside kinase (ribokinase family)